MKKYISAALSLASVGMLFYIIYHQKEQIQTLQSSQPNVDSLHQVIDSLNNELFIQNTNTTRYETAIERLRENYPQAADQFDDCLKNIE
jgi:translation initiation factor 2B subunit (eIF-2B alpha/beta/delta family)